MTSWNETIRKRPLVFLAILFSFGLPFSKSAVTVLTTILCAWLAFRAVLRPVFRASAGRNLLQPLTIPFLFLLAVALLGVLYTGKTSDGLAIANKVVTLPLIYIAFTLVIGTAKEENGAGREVRAMETAFLAGTLFLNCIAFLTYLGVVGHKRFELPLAPMHMHHIWFANLNAVAVYTAIALFLEGAARAGRRWKAFLISCIAFSAVAILLSISRTAWMGMFVTGIVLAFFFLPRRAFLAGLAAALLLCGLAYRFSPLVHDRVNQAFSDVAVYEAGKTGTETSVGDRFLMWKGAIRMFRSNPVFGVGTGDYQATMDGYIRSGMLPERLLQYNQPHNMYLFTLATNGLLGLGALLYIFYRVFRHAFPAVKRNGSERAEGFLALATVVHFMVAGMSDSLFNIFVLRHTFAFIMALTVRSRPNSQE